MGVLSVLANVDQAFGVLSLGRETFRVICCAVPIPRLDECALFTPRRLSSLPQRATRNGTYEVEAWSVFTIHS